MKYALFSVPVGTIYDLPQTIKEGEEGLVSTIGDEGLYGQACQVRTAPGGVTAAGVQLPPDVPHKFHKNPVFLWFLILVRDIRNDFLFKRSLIGISCPVLCAYKINISFRHIDKQHHFPSIPFSHFDHDFLLLYFSSFHR